MAFQTHVINSQPKDFIAGWYISPNTCDQLIEFFETNQQYQMPGVVGDQLTVDHSIKQSTDLTINKFQDSCVSDYFEQLAHVTEEYKHMYPQCTETGIWGINLGVQIQRYLPNEGFHKLHCEICEKPQSSRHLVFMTYLNDVTDCGETEWPHWGVKLKPEKGLTVIWPPSFTHMHKGIASPTQTKYIVTGWYSHF